MRLLALFSLILPLATSALESDRFNSYQYNGKAGKPWYEWWYYKVVLPGTDEAFFFTYGIVNPWDEEGIMPGTRAHLSFGSFKDHWVVDREFDVSEFSASREKPWVEVSGNVGTDRFLRGAIPERGISWDITLEHDWRYDAMTWVMPLKGASNIYWYPAQASARMSGRIELPDRTIELRDAPAYQDRNWGASFPKWWAWLVSNHFEGSPGTALAAGGGRPKAFNQIEGYEGLSIGFRHAGKEYFFRPQTGDIVRLHIHFGRWEVEAFNQKLERIRINAHAPREKFLILPFNAPNGEVFLDYEALQGTIRVELSKWRPFGWEIVADVTTEQGGIEFGSFDPQDFERLFAR